MITVGSIVKVVNASQTAWPTEGGLSGPSGSREGGYQLTETGRAITFVYHGYPDEILYLDSPMVKDSGDYVVEFLPMGRAEVIACEDEVATYNSTVVCRFSCGSELILGFTMIEPINALELLAEASD